MDLYSDSEEWEQDDDDYERQRYYDVPEGYEEDDYPPHQPGYIEFEPDPRNQPGYQEFESDPRNYPGYQEYPWYPQVQEAPEGDGVEVVDYEDDVIDMESSM